MNENTKTSTFLAVAAVVVAAVWFTRPVAPVADKNNMLNQLLFPEFTDPLAATTLKIIEYDESQSVMRDFEVTQAQTKDGKVRWSIPSHDNYPADAKEHLAEAATGVMGLKVLEMPSDSPGDHHLYGVIDPNSDTLKFGDTGVGTYVTMKDAQGKSLLALVVGKAVSDQSGLRFVRRSGEDQVYVVAVNPEKLSTEFSDWIEKDLLKLNAWDIKRLWFRDHSVDEVNGLVIQEREITVAYDDTADPKWKLLSDKDFVENKWVSVPVPEDEELNTTRLDDAKTALDDLKIVDVRPKPPGLSADLKAANDFARDQEAAASLGTRGFHLARIDGADELVSNEGEIRCLMKDGVEYVLRFGDIASGSAMNSSKKKKENADKPQGTGLNRYLFVACEFNPEPIPKPELEALPELPAKVDEAAKEKDDESKDAGQPDKDADKPAADSDVEKERQRIEKENQRKQDEYDEKIAEGKKRVSELNARFADWYYIIPDDVFQKIDLTRAEIFQKIKKDEKAAKGGHAGHDHATPHSNNREAADNPVTDLDALKAAGPGTKK